MLFVAPTLPAAGGNGLAMRVGMFLEAYAGMADVDCLVVRLAGGPPDEAFCRRHAQRLDVIEIAGRAETPFALVSAIADPAIRVSTFRDYGRPSLCGYLSVPIRDELRMRAGTDRYDLVHISRACLLPLLETISTACPRARVVVDLDEDEASTRRSLARLHRVSGNLLAAEWEEAEALAYARLSAEPRPVVDLVTVASSREAARAAVAWRASRMAVVPNAVTVPPPRPASPTPRLILMGSLGYFPNRDAARWTLGAIWPRIKARCPEAALWVVGRNAGPALRRLARRPGVRLLERVPDVGPIYRSCAVAVAPIRAGGGTRIKIIEAGAYALPCVSTTIGAEGLSDGRPAGLALANSTEGLADACLERLRSPTLRRSEGQRLRSFVTRKHDRGQTMACIVRLASSLC
jgi:glycosyltransferase involved in cell wall biosynthesis